MNLSEYNKEVCVFISAFLLTRTLLERGWYLLNVQHWLYLLGRSLLFIRLYVTEVRSYILYSIGS